MDHYLCYHFPIILCGEIVSEPGPLTSFAHVQIQDCFENVEA